MATLGTILTIDLSSGTQSAAVPEDSEVRSVLMGRGHNSLRLLRSSRCDVPPLSPENPLLITCGLLTGSPAPTAARVQVSARSPLTGLLGSSSVGGRVGPALKSVGIQGLEILGASPGPVYLFLDGESAEVRDARHLWGLETPETCARLFEEHADPGLVMLVIGPAGEKQVPIACIVTQRGHAAGRTGMGAVMGSKHLKAIVVRPRKGRPPAEPEVREAVKAYLDAVRASPDFADTAAHGTSSGVLWAQDRGVLATRNYEEAVFEGAEATDGTSLDAQVEGFRACQGCPVHCKAEVRLRVGRFAGSLVERPDFEPLVAWGAKSGLADMEAVVSLHHLCDRLGLDSVSAGSSVAFAMALYEHGIIDAGDTSGLELTWGNFSAMESLVWQMAAVEGFGGILGKGVREAARIIGRGAERHAMHVKGLELTAQDPRGAFATGLGYAVSSRGGDFTSVYARHDYSLTPDEAQERYGLREAADRFSTVGKGEMVRRSMSVCAVLDGIGICKLPALTLINAYDFALEARLVSTIMGEEFTPAEFFTVGERILNIERLFNVRCGLAPEDDDLPAVFLDESVDEGPTAGRTVDLEPMLREFYQVMGWDECGRPTLERLRELGLEGFVSPEGGKVEGRVTSC